MSQQVTRDRLTRLGASDIPIILGLSPYANAYTLHLEKTGQLEEWIGNDATEDGKLFEPVILTKAEQKLGRIERDVFFPCPLGNPIGSTTDGIVIENGHVVEAKTSGMGDRPVVGQWGVEGTNEIPEQYLVQVQVQMHCAKTDTAHVAAWLGHRGIKYYRVERDQEVIDQIIAMASSWWQKHVIEGVAPSASDPPPVEVFKRLKREPSKVVSLKKSVDKLVERWEKAKAKESKAKDAQEKIKAQLLLSMKDAEKGVTPGGTVLSYFESARAGYTVQPGKVRTFRVSKKKDD